MSKCRKAIRDLSLVFMTTILILSSVISVYGTDTEGSGTGGASYVPGEVLVCIGRMSQRIRPRLWLRNKGMKGLS